MYNTLYKELFVRCSLAERPAATEALAPRQQVNYESWPVEVEGEEEGEGDYTFWVHM